MKLHGVFNTTVFWNAVMRQWNRITAQDRVDIERNGIASLVQKLQALYGLTEDEALAQINAVNISLQRIHGPI